MESKISKVQSVWFLRIELHICGHQEPKGYASNFFNQVNQNINRILFATISMELHL